MKLTLQSAGSNQVQKSSSIAEGNENKCSNTNYLLEKGRALIAVGVVS
jgi:hypothetical protein